MILILRRARRKRDVPFFQFDELETLPIEHVGFRQMRHPLQSRRRAVACSIPSGTRKTPAISRENIAAFIMPTPPKSGFFGIPEYPLLPQQGASVSGSQAVRDTSGRRGSPPSR